MAMNAVSRSILILVSSLLVAEAVAESAGLSKISSFDAAVNSSKGGFAWVTGIDQEDLESKDQVPLLDESKDQVSSLDEAETGGFPTLESMLHWAIGHSDPQKLKDAAREGGGGRGYDFTELMERFRALPSDADLMKVAINDLLNSSLSAEDHKRALDELLELVEPIDNANDLNKLGGLEAVIKGLERPEVELRTAAAWVLGKACQNNPLVQSQALGYDVLPTLMKMVLSASEEEAVKALYAVSAIIRNYPTGHEAFYEHGGASLLEALLSNPSTTESLTRKSLFLVADLAEQVAEVGGKLRSYVPQEELLKSVVHRLKATDVDTQEKALMAVRSLARISGTQEALKNLCNLDSALEDLKIWLEKLMLNEDQAEFAKDMENLRQEVVRYMQEKESSHYPEHLQTA